MGTPWGSFFQSWTIALLACFKIAAFSYKVKLFFFLALTTGVFLGLSLGHMESKCLTDVCCDNKQQDVSYLWLLIVFVCIHDSFTFHCIITDVCFGFVTKFIHLLFTFMVAFLCRQECRRV